MYLAGRGKYWWKRKRVERKIREKVVKDEMAEEKIQVRERMAG